MHKYAINRVFKYMSKEGAILLFIKGCKAMLTVKEKEDSLLKKL